MLKKRFFLFIIIFSFLIIVFNFSLVSASLEGASKIRLLSLSIILSILEIAVAALAFSVFFKSAAGFSKKENQLSLILNNTEQGILVHNISNEVILLNSKAEEILGINFKDVAGMPLSVESSLRNQKLNKLVGVVFYSKLEPEGEKKFSISNKEIRKDKDLFFLKTFKEEPLWHKVPDLKSIIDTAYLLRTPLSEIKWLIKTFLEGSGSTLAQNQVDILKKSQDANENAIKIVNDLLDIYKKASENEKKE